MTTLTFDFWQRLAWLIVTSAGGYLAGHGVGCYLGDGQPWWVMTLVFIVTAAVWMPAAYVLHPNAKQYFRKRYRRSRR